MPPPNERSLMLARRLYLAASLALLPYAACAATPQPAERGRVGFYSLAQPSAAGLDVVDRLEPYAFGLTQPLVGADLIAVNARGGRDADIAHACNGERVNAIVVFFYADKTTPQGPANTELAEAHFDVFDCYGDIAFDGAGTAEADIDAGRRDGTFAEAKTATDRAFSALRSDVRAGDTTLGNLVRYGIPVRNGERTAGLTLRAGALGARARPMAFGTAARAGIRRDDLIVSLNGTPLAGLSGSALDALLASAEAAGGSYAAEVRAADGKTTTHTFKSEDLAGYLRL